jgi:hypothetical protein
VAGRLSNKLDQLVSHQLQGSSRGGIQQRAAQLAIDSKASGKSSIK